MPATSRERYLRTKRGSGEDGEQMGLSFGWRVARERVGSEKGEEGERKGRYSTDGEKNPAAPVG